LFHEQKQMQSALDAGAKLPLYREYVTSEARDLPSTPSDLPDAIKTSFAEKQMQKGVQELPVETQVSPNSSSYFLPCMLRYLEKPPIGTPI
jgi:hypothetical protein